MTSESIKRTPASFPFWQGCTIALMAVGYAGYYLCRSDLSVAMPMLIREMSSRGVSPDVAKVQLGTVASLGVLAQPSSPG